VPVRGTWIYTLDHFHDLGVVFSFVRQGDDHVLEFILSLKLDQFLLDIFPRLSQLAFLGVGPRRGIESILDRAEIAFQRLFCRCVVKGEFPCR